MARTEIRVGRYIFDLVPVVFLILTAILCNQFNDSVNNSRDAVKLASDMNRQRTAAEMRAMHAEREAAKNGGGSFNVFVIQPDKRNASSPAYVDLNKPL
ncbi:MULTISPECIES: hypothetical protein [Klebsiella/Raoultella group]|uniref:hypothetical protein n=1 Tax=Klebsiella/Raoultella group TaxID=2890311 RepID=UPI000F4D401F|nr:MULTISPECIES: hypothetical protein [Klebsiella]AYW18568.1 hypothetical protein DTA24_07850 [Klebsiella sp. P1CD1]